MRSDCGSISDGSSTARYFKSYPSTHCACTHIFVNEIRAFKKVCLFSLYSLIRSSCKNHNVDCVFSYHLCCFELKSSTFHYALRSLYLFSFTVEKFLENFERRQLHIFFTFKLNTFSCSDLFHPDAKAKR